MPLAMCVAFAGCRRPVVGASSAGAGPGAAGLTEAAGATGVTAPATRVREAFNGPLPRMDGDRLRMRLVEVTYPPGGASPPHRHACPVVGYVVRGAVRMQVDGAPEIVYRAGDTFYEAPDAAHLVSANASRAEPATFLAASTCQPSTPPSAPPGETVGRRRTTDGRRDPEPRLSRP